MEIQGSSEKKDGLKERCSERRQKVQNCCLTCTVTEMFYWSQEFVPDVVVLPKRFIGQSVWRCTFAHCLLGIILEERMLEGIWLEGKLI